MVVIIQFFKVEENICNFGCFKLQGVSSCRELRYCVEHISIPFLYFGTKNQSRGHSQAYNDKDTHQDLGEVE